MVATSHPLAAQAGIQIMQEGGNAIDAAIAAASALTVVEPTANGIGSDAFAIVWSDGKLYGLNSSGPAPRHLTLDWMKSRGFAQPPAYGWGSVTVPGAPAAWAALSRRFGRLSLASALAPAVILAEIGHPVTDSVAAGWSRAVDRFKQALRGTEYQEWFRVFAPQGVGPVPGELWRLPDHAKTLRDIGETEANAFYRGTIAQTIVDFARKTGGVISMDDLGSFAPEWVEPLSVSFRGYEVWEMPPNCQGLIALTALGILEGLKPDSPEERIHYQIEALKLGFADGFAYIGDPTSMRESAQALLDPNYLRSRRALLGERAIQATAGRPPRGGTVYLATADGEGNMVSLIQSNYRGFGSGLVVPGTGIALQNRGALFSLDPGHPNCLMPGKRPFNTIIPGFVTCDGRPLGPFGVMGGYMQPQGHVQVICRALDQNLNPQAALDAPRFYWKEGNRVAVEASMPEEIVQSLRKRGHEIEVVPDPLPFGRGQIIWRDPEGVLQGGTEPRTDGHVAVW